jgi:hypothetical protein
MKRFDSLIAVVLVSLASFVGVEATAGRRTRVAFHLVDAPGTSAVAMSSAGSSAAQSAVSTMIQTIVVTATRDDPATYRRVADARRRLEDRSPGTFIGELLSAHDSSLARWPERLTQPLRIWIQSSPDLLDWTPETLPIVRDAFRTWSGIGIPLAFTFVLDSASADVHVTWVDHFDEQISGKTLWSHDERWWILEANIILAVHHRSGEALDEDATRAIALHEVGHLIGLDHTADSTSIMTPRVRVKELSTADRATAELLYLLPAGRIGGRTRMADDRLP